ncbi:Cupin 2 conserved barrel domain protein [halophilic archaeon DL31]|jgi:quercetin dioxygenase-like cupin family protein|nr:Cupin 2 conserved barrel domain protein [halophilic archaeon DL31]
MSDHASLEHVSLANLDSAPHAAPFGQDEPRTVRLALDAGESVAEHEHPGKTIICYVVEGVLDLSLDGEEHRLEAGALARFSGDQAISPTAVEDASVLLVLAE